MTIVTGSSAGWAHCERHHRMIPHPPHIVSSYWTTANGTVEVWCRGYGRLAGRLIRRGSPSSLSVIDTTPGSGATNDPDRETYLDLLLEQVHKLAELETQAPALVRRTSQILRASGMRPPSQWSALYWANVGYRDYANALRDAVRAHGVDVSVVLSPRRPRRLGTLVQDLIRERRSQAEGNLRYWRDRLSGGMHE